MKLKRTLFCFLLSSSFLISGCQQDEGKGDYSGVSDLIADRNKARYEVKEKPPSRPNTQRKTAPQTKPSRTKEEELSYVVLYEQEVDIIGSDSGRTLAKGVAYVNKKGQIVRIKILKE